MSVLVRAFEFYDMLPIGESIIPDALLDVNMINSTFLKACPLKSRMALIDNPPLDSLLSVLGFANKISCGIQSLKAHGCYRRSISSNAIPFDPAMTHTYEVASQLFVEERFTLKQ